MHPVAIQRAVVGRQFFVDKNVRRDLVYVNPAAFRFPELNVGLRCAWRGMCGRMLYVPRDGSRF
jgi:hypothetical protein